MSTNSVPVVFGETSQLSIAIIQRKSFQRRSIRFIVSTTKETGFIIFNKLQ